MLVVVHGPNYPSAGKILTAREYSTQTHLQKFVRLYKSTQCETNISYFLLVNE